METKLYKKQIMIKDWDYDDHSQGKIILDWTDEEKWDGKIPTFRYEYAIFERFVEVKK